MESRFPAVLVLWLGTEFCRGMHGNSEGMEPSAPDPGDFGDDMWDLKSTGIFLVSLLTLQPLGFQIAKFNEIVTLKENVILQVVKFWTKGFQPPFVVIFAP
ncbi:hypothetical protein AVEN_159702-1 [Araneus ventricosus]|uniref:Uncharacterized protein n=1 Tax=Araneus ventricosus TaxID=182803 RepID=A0A4Y2M4Z3_ARAVE|nr:hypothetical protein AVEN_159702-1 [Araneus ventricosus]